MSHHRYKSRDFRFAQLLITLRKRAGLTQEEVSLKMTVTVRAIGNWEGGSNYPSELNLRKLIEIYLDTNAFLPEQERNEGRILWDQLRTSTPRRIGPFDEQWFTNLLAERQRRSANQTQLKLSEEQQPTRLSVLEERKPEGPPSRLPWGDWSEMLDVSALCGRTDELAELERWLLTDQCRLITILGMGGIGKTILASKLVQQVAPHFEYVRWRSLHNAPSLKDILSDLLPVLTRQHDGALPQNEDQLLSLLIKHLQERRCLLVLDNLETLFQEEALEGRYREEYKGYAKLIQYVAEMAHHSCLLLISRELFPDLGVLTGRQARVRVFRLGGLPISASQQMLRDKELFGNQQDWRDLVQRYTGNPLALKIVAEIVHELFSGDIAAFLAEGFTTFHGLRQILTQQFERISALEQALMYWMAIEREPVSLETLQQDLLQAVSKSEVMEAIHSLRGRSLVEREEYGAIFTLQPVVLEYITERLVTLISEEIREGKPMLLLKYALLKGQAKDYVRASQARLILQPVLNRLTGNTRSQEEQLERLLSQLRAMPYGQQGYGGGNVVNLFVQLNDHMRGRDCSHLMVWQADLQQAEAQDANFAGSDLTGSAFMGTIDSILSVALSPNGRYLASGSNRGDIYVWRVADGLLLLTLRGHKRLTWSLAFHPEGTLLASGGYDGLVKIWEINSGQCVNTLQGHNKWVKAVSFHPTGKLLATCSDDKSIRLWDFTDGHCIKAWQEQTSEVCSVAFSPDGLLLASGQADGLIKIRDVTTQQDLWSVTAHSGRRVLSLAFSPDGEFLVSGGQDTMLMVWQTHTGKHLSTLSGHTGAIHSVIFNTERLLVSCSHDCTVKVWQVGRGEEAAHYLETLEGHSGWVWSIASGPDGLLASGSHDGVVKLWQMTGQGKRSRCFRTLRGYSRLINSLAFSPDGRILIGSENNGAVRMWETKSGQCQCVLSKQAGDSFAVAFHPDGHIFAYASSNDNAIKLWEVSGTRYLRTLQGHQREIWSLAWSPDGRFLASGGVDTTIKLWEISSGQCLATFQGHSNWVWPVTFSPDGTLLASGGFDGLVKLWRIDNGQCLQTLQSGPHAILALTFTADSQALLSVNAKGCVAMWEVKSGHYLKTMLDIGKAFWLGSVALSANGHFLAVASDDQTVQVWNVKNEKLIRTFSCDAGRPWSVALSNDQQLLANGTDEGTITLWEWQTGKYLRMLQSERPYERMNISHAIGLSEAQKDSLKLLGAIEEDKIQVKREWQ